MKETVIPKEYRADYRFRYRYNTPGHCPKCEGRLWHESQSGACPPRWRCLCGYSDFDTRGPKVDYDVLETMNAGRG